MGSKVTPSRTIVVTGGGSGIGRAVVLACATRGDSVAVLDKRADFAMTAAELARSNGSNAAIGLSCDVTSEDQVADAFEIVSKQLGTPYGLFANAGIDTGGLTHELSIETWRLVIDTNLTGVFLSCKHALRLMLSAREEGSIVCTSSPTGSVALASGGTGAYSATKAGISALVRCMAIDYARHGIRVNAIVPGATETPLMWSNVRPEDVANMRAQVSNEIPLGRLAEPDEVAKAVTWLLSNESSYITGSHLVCDGGILAKASITV